MMDNLLLGICILLIGVMFYYFNGRLSILESTIVKQNHVLTDFITNVKSNTSNHGATLEAMHVAKGYHENSPDMDYIEVTDSEDDDSTSSEDTISNTVEPSVVKVIPLGDITDSRTLNTVEPSVVKVIPLGDITDSRTLNTVEPSVVKVIPLGDITDSRTLNTVEPSVVKVIPLGDITDRRTLNTVEPSVKVIQLGDITDRRTLDTLFKESTVEPLEEDDDGITVDIHDGITVDIHDGSTIDYSKMKISQLRLILADKGIVPKGKNKLDLVNALQETNL
jgi:hypothetical protein